MKTEARLIKALRDKQLLQSNDTIKAAKLSSDELLSLNGQILVLIKRKKRQKKEDTSISLPPESLSHFTFSDGKNSFMFMSRDKDRVGAIADFIIDFVDVEEE